MFLKKITTEDYTKKIERLTEIQVLKKSLLKESKKTKVTQFF